MLRLQTWETKCARNSERICNQIKQSMKFSVSANHHYRTKYPNPQQVETAHIYYLKASETNIT